MSESTIINRNPYRPERIRARLAIGIVLSILVHAFILSLQFGIPGLALPGLELPWEKRRAQAPELTVQLTDVTPPAQQAEPLPVPLPPPSELPPLPKPATEGFTLLAPVKPPEPVPATPTQAKAKPVAAIKKAGKPKPPLPVPLAAEAVATPPDVITRLDSSDDKFVVPVRNPEDPEKPAANNADKAASLAQAAEPQVAEVAASKPAEDLSLQKQAAEAEAKHLQEVEERKLADDAKQKADALAARKQEELRQEELKQARAQEMLAQANRQQENEAREKQKAEQLASDAAQLASRQAARQAAALALQKQQEALQLQAQERARQQAEADKARELLKIQQAREEIAKAQQLEVQRQEEQKRQEQQKQQAMQLAQQQERELQERQAAELQVSKQAEEAARQQALAQAQARQKQQDELAARQRADELARQQAEAASAAAQQRARELAAQTAAANSANSANAGNAGNVDGKPAQGFVLPKSLLGSDLASRALDQAKKLDLLRGNPPVRRLEDDSKGRRRSIFGSIKEDVPLRMYVESWRQKIERNGNLNYSQIAKDKARGDPVVTVVIRSDGSVEEIIFNRSSGRADIDEAVRRIVRVNARYSAFPPNIAERYDVIEIRRIWNFDETLKIMEEVLQ
ncbi:MAG: TonB C-terminal domain-containing protein [Pseudomonadota bacterium]